MSGNNSKPRRRTSSARHPRLAYLLLRCFGSKLEPGNEQLPDKNQGFDNNGANQKSYVSAAPGGASVGALRPSQAVEVAVKVPQVEAEAEQLNGHVGSGVVLNAVPDVESERQGASVDCPVPSRISFGSPLLLFNTPSLPTHHSLTLKLQDVARGSSARVDHWVALSSVADGFATTESSERTTEVSSPGTQQQHQRQPGMGMDGSASTAPAGPTAAVVSSTPIGTLSIRAATAAYPKPHEPRAHRAPEPPAEPRPPQLPSHLLPGAAKPGGGLPLSPELQRQLRAGISQDHRTPPAASGAAGHTRISPSRWSVGSGGDSVAPQIMSDGASLRGPHAAAAACGGGSGAVAGCCTPGGCPSPLPPATRTIPTEELAALVTCLARVRDHWLESLQAVAVLAAELLGADSLSVYLLSDSGATHAALACHGDAGGAIRLGMPLPAMAAPSQRPTALQRLYMTGEPQRRSVWGATAGAAPASKPLLLPTPPAMVPATAAADATVSPCLLLLGATAAVHPQHYPCNQPLAPQQHLQQQRRAWQQQQLLLQHRGEYPPNQQWKPQQQHPHQQPKPGASSGGGSPLPSDWHSMRVLGGMTDFVAVPLLRGDTVIGALQVVDNCTPPEDMTVAVPASRRCRGVAELAVVAAFVATLLVDHEVLCLMGALEAVAAAQDVDGLVRALARHVGLFCCMRSHITPGVRVALIRGDAAALALFLDEGATAAAAAAAAAGGSTTPAGVLSTAFSRNSTACNLLQTALTIGGSGLGGLYSGATTPRPMHSPGASASGMAAARGSQAAGGGAGAGRCVVPLYSPYAGARDPSSLFDTNQSLPAMAFAGIGAGATGPRAPAAAAAAPVGVAASVRPSAMAVGGNAGNGTAESAPSLAHVHGNTSTLGFGGSVLTGMSTAADLWPLFASTTGGPMAGAAAAGDGQGRKLTAAATGDAAAAVAASSPRSPRLAACASVASDDGRVITCAGDGHGTADELTSQRSCADASPSAAGRHPIPIGGSTAAAVTVVPKAAKGARQRSEAAELSLHGAVAVAIASAQAAGASATMSTAGAADVEEAAGSAAAVASVAAATSASASMSLFSAPLPMPAPNSAAGLRAGAVGSGLYGRALATAGEDANASGGVVGGQGPGQVQGHAMLTRGTVLAEALSAGSGMYISDVAIYMQDGRNKSRDVFLTPSGRRGPAQGTNSLAVTTVSHGGVPLLGLYLTYGTPLPASLLNALISKVHLFGALLGPLLHERLAAEESDLADEWRYLLGEVLDPQAIQSAADEQRSRRSSAAPYNQLQQNHHHHQPQQQQQQPLVTQAPPPPTALPSPLHALTGVAATRPSSRHGLLQPARGAAIGAAGMPTTTRCSSCAAGVAAPSAAAALAVVAAGRASGRPSRQGQRASGSGSRALPKRNVWGPGGSGGVESGGGTVPPVLRRAQTADDGSLHCSASSSSRVLPSVDGVEAVVAAAAAARALIRNRGGGCLQASVTAEAAVKAAAACALEAATFASAGGGGVGDTLNGNYSSAAVLPQPSPRGALAVHVGPSAALGRKVPLSDWSQAMLPALPPSPSMQHTQQQQQWHRTPLPSPGESPQQRQPPAPAPSQSSSSRTAAAAAVGQLANRSWRGPAAAAGALRGSPGARAPTGPFPGVSPAAAAAAASGSAMGVRSAILAAGRSPDGVGGLLYVDPRAVQVIDSNNSSGTAIMSRSASGLLGPMHAPAGAPVSPPPLQQGESGPAAAADAGGGGVAESAATGSSTPRTPAVVLSGGAVSSGGSDGGGRPASLLLPMKSCLKVSETSPSAASAAAAEGGLGQQRLLHYREEQGSPSPPPPPQQLQQQHVLPGAHMNLFAAGCPVSPPSGARTALSHTGAAAGDAAAPGGFSSLPRLRPAATLPLPLSTGVAAARRLRRSPSAASTAVASTVLTASTSQLELASRVRVLPAYLVASSSLGGGGAAASSSQSASGATASSHCVDVELSMQAWHVPSHAPPAFVAAIGSRHTLCGPFSLHGGPGQVGAGGGDGHDLAAGGGHVSPLLAQPRPCPLAPSPLSVSRHAPCAASPFARRLSSVNGLAPVVPPQPRVGAGLSRLTTVATAAGNLGGGGCGSAAVAVAAPVSGATARSAAVVAAAAAGGGWPGLTALSSSKVPSPVMQRLRCSIRRNTSFNIMADPGVQDTCKVAPLMANLQDKLRSLQAEQVLARLHSRDPSGADELSGLTILEPLGSGGFGAVFRGVFNGIEVAVKVLCERGAACRSEAATMREAFELAVMTTVSHPHIVQVLSAFTDVILSTQPGAGCPGGGATPVVLPRTPATEELGDPTVVIAMEYCDGGSLADAITAGRFRQRVPGGYGALQPCMPAIYATLLEIALALRHMHAMLLVHCDLKPANILLKSNMRDPRGFSAKLSDFGLVKMVVEDGTGGGGGVIGRDARTGTITHMAPELIQATESSKMDTSVDIYAFGVLMWEMLSSCPVYLGLGSEDIRRGVVASSLRPDFPPWSDEKYRALAESCLSTDPRSRPTAAQLVARLRTLLAESGALQDTILRRHRSTAPFATANHPGAAGGACAGGSYFPGSYTAAAAGALLGIGADQFSRPSRLMVMQQHQQTKAQAPATDCPQLHQPGRAGAWGPQPQTGVGGTAAGGPHSWRGRSRSYGGHDSSTFPLHIL